MDNERDDLLQNELLDDDIDRITLGAIKDQVSGALSWTKDKVEEVGTVAKAVTAKPEKEMLPELDALELDRPEKMKGQEDIPTPNITSIPKRPLIPKPEFGEDLSYETRQLLNTNWEFLQQQLAIGGMRSSLYAPVSTYQQEAEEVFMWMDLTKNVAENLPQRKFMGFEPMEAPCQVVLEGDINLDFTQMGTQLVADTPDIGITSRAIEAKSRKLRTKVSSEFMDSVEREAAADIIAVGLLAEWHDEMLDMFRDVATSSVAVTASPDEPTSKDIIQQIMLLSDQIHRNNHHDHEQWAIMSPAMAAIVAQDRQAFDPSTAARLPMADCLGTVCGINVYIDRGVKPNEMFVGKKSNRALDNPITYKPYNLVYPMGSVVNPVTFENEYNFGTRGCYHIAPNAEKSIMHTEFKADYKKQEVETDAGYFYAPYIPLMKTKVRKGEEWVEVSGQELEDLIDVDIPYDPGKQQTIAAILGGFNDD